MHRSTERLEPFPLLALTCTGTVAYPALAVTSSHHSADFSWVRVSLVWTPRASLTRSRVVAGSQASPGPCGRLDTPYLSLSVTVTLARPQRIGSHLVVPTNSYSMGQACAQTGADCQNVLHLAINLTSAFSAEDRCLTRCCMRLCRYTK